MKMAEVAEILLWSCLSLDKGHELGCFIKYNSVYLLGQVEYLVTKMVEYIRVKTLTKNPLCLKEIGMDW
jgi:hypothetical protein